MKLTCKITLSISNNNSNNRKKNQCILLKVAVSVFAFLAKKHIGMESIVRPQDLNPT